MEVVSSMWDGGSFPRWSNFPPTNVSLVCVWLPQQEQLYHPAYFKTVTCQDWPNANCPRGNLCAFWHKRCQQRARPATVEDDYDYDSPLSELQIETLQPDFVSPPSKLFNSIQNRTHATGLCCRARRPFSTLHRVSRQMASGVGDEWVRVCA